MEQSKAFVPGHISGFFEINDEPDNALKMGSRNAGLCISKGVRTTVEVREERSSDIEVSIDDEVREARTTKSVVKELVRKSGDEFYVRVNHDVQLPIGVGYGMSGAGALGASLALSDVLDLDMSYSEMAAVAHKAEVECKSGLGDVYPQMLGGIVLGVEPGAPPFGRLKKLNFDEDLQLIIGSLGSVSTSDILGSQNSRGNSKIYGGRAFDNFSSDKSLQNFMEVSKNFDINMGIFDEDFIDILEYLDSKSPYGAAVALLGETIFSPVQNSHVEKVKNHFREFFDEEKVINPGIDYQGARIEDN